MGKGKKKRNEATAVAVSEKEGSCPRASGIDVVPDVESCEPNLMEMDCSPKKKKKNMKKKDEKKEVESVDKSLGSLSLEPELGDESPEPLVESALSNVEPISLQKKKETKKKRKNRSEILENDDIKCEIPSLQPQLVQLSDQVPGALTGSPLSNVEPTNPPKKKAKKKIKKKNMSEILENNDMSCESPYLKPQLVQLPDQELGALTESPLSNVEPSSPQKKKAKRKIKKKNVSEILENDDMSCVSPSLKPQLVQLLDQELEAREPLMGSPLSHVEPSSPQKKKTKKKKKNTSEILETDYMNCEGPSLQPQLVQLSDQELDVPQAIEELSSTSTVKNKRKSARKKCKPLDCNDKVNKVGDPKIQPSAEISSEQIEFEEPLAEVMRQETKKKSRRKSREIKDSKELSVETMDPAEDPSIQPTLASISEQVLDSDENPLVMGTNTTVNSESPKPKADSSFSQKVKKKSRKKEPKTNDSTELLVEIMTPEADPSLQPALAIFPEHKREVPLTEGISTTIKSPKVNIDIKEKRKKKILKKKCKTSESKEVAMTPEGDPSLQPKAPLSHLPPKAGTDVVAIAKQGNLLPMPNSSIVDHPPKKLLILDLNGLLCDILPMDEPIPRGHRPDMRISRKPVFKRPFCAEFLQFCFDRFNVGVWSSRNKKNVELAINPLFRTLGRKLLFCWNQSHCTHTKFKTLENNKKPIVFKDLRKLWDKRDPNLPWARGEYNESNTLLVDDSPYKALINPENTAIFPKPYEFRNETDSSLGPGGDIRSYLEGVALAENVQKHVQQNPFGQPPITSSDPSWNFYRKVIEDVVPVG